MEKIIRGEITNYLDENTDGTIDRSELLSIVQKVLIKLLLEIRTSGEDEKSLETK